MNTGWTLWVGICLYACTFETGCPPFLAPCIRVFAEWVVCERTLLLASTDDPTIVLMILCEVVVTLESRV